MYVVVVVLTSLVLGAAGQEPRTGSVPAVQPREDVRAAPAEPGEWVYTVRPGDSLWVLSRDYLADPSYWPEVRRRNGIAHPRRLRAGTRLRIPLAWLKQRPSPATVLAVRGDVIVDRAITHARGPLAVGSSLGIGDVIVTGTDASATIQFADESRLVLASTSRLAFDRLTLYGPNGMVDTALRLERGRTWSVVPPGGRHGRFRLTTPAAVAVARGTELRVAADEQQAMRAEVLEGIVDVEGSRSAGAPAQAVTAGFGIEVQAGQPPSTPVALLPAPALAASLTVRRVPLRVEIPHLEGAAAYRLEIATDAGFSESRWDGLSQTATIHGPDLPDGRYAMRARAVDARGLEGRDAVGSLVIDARPEPPVLLEPAAQATVDVQRPALQWTSAAGAAGYRVQVATDDRFEGELALDEITDTGSVVTPPLAPGRYFWRVATRDARGDTGPFGDAQPFVRRNRPAGPSGATTDADARRLVMRWTAGGATGTTYHYQLARDQGFTATASEGTVDAPEAIIDRPPAGSYFLRIKTIEPDGFEGAYGTEQRLEVVPLRRHRRWWPWLLLPLGGVLVVVLS